MAESSAVPDLRKNPLMLALMCIIYRGENWIPRNRPDMYEHCATLLFNKWDSSRQIYVDLKASAFVDGAIKHLAYWMFTEAAGAQGVTESALVHEAARFLAPAFNSSVETESAARQFVAFCRGRAWVLTDMGTTAEGESLFGFTHRTFMEYFAGYELTRLNHGPERVAKIILPHVAAAEWEIVAELAVQISNKHSRDGAARILKTLLGDRRYRSATSRLNIGAFSFRCLGFVHLPSSLAVQVARYYLEAALKFGAEGNKIRLEPCNVVADLRQPVEDEIVAVLASHISGETSARNAVAIEIALELPRIMMGSPTYPDVALESSGFRLWVERRRELFARLGSEVLSKRDDVAWFGAWRHGLISLENLVIDGPRAAEFPLEILFVSTMYTRLETGWKDWGSFMPERLLQSGADEIDGFPATIAELTWLCEFIDQLPPPPWVRAAAVSVSLNGGFDGDFLAAKLTEDYGWTLFLLMLIAIEAQGKSVITGTYTEGSRRYYAAVNALASRRFDNYTLPPWITEMINSLPTERRALVSSWLDQEVNFTC